MLYLGLSINHAHESIIYDYNDGRGETNRKTTRNLWQLLPKRSERAVFTGTFGRSRLRIIDCLNTECDKPKTAYNILIRRGLCFLVTCRFRPVDFALQSSCWDSTRPFKQPLSQCSCWMNPLMNKCMEVVGCTGYNMLEEE